MIQMMPLILLLLEVQSLVFLTGVSSSELPWTIAKRCKDRCGDLKIPYPFGIGKNCSCNSFFEIKCSNNTPILQHYKLEVTDIKWPQRLEYGSDDVGLEENNQTLTVLTRARNTCSNSDKLGFEGSPYRFSELNDFMVVGCGADVLMKNRSGHTLTGCAPLCANSSSIETTACSGFGCCHKSIGVHGLASYDVSIDQTTATVSNICTSLTAGLISRQSMKQTEDLRKRMFPTVLTWSVPNLAPRNSSEVNCYSTNSSGDCICTCNLRFEGNPYIPNGCQVVRECQKCAAENCDFDNWHPRKGERFRCVNPFLKLSLVLVFSLGMGSVLLLLSSCWLCRVIEKKKEANSNARYFKRNGGLLLQQHLSSGEERFDKTKIFRVFELEKATNNFNRNRILGQGGQGTVFKGMLTDGKPVAIKKSRLVDESQLEHFINELVILSQINHRNVVKLLGCCLETKVPLLVYEFIPNGTLYHLLHNPSEDFHITWQMRLQIAAESANALAYLHSSSSTPIYHRDIKSSNILLDENYRAKVSDFGISRVIHVEQTHVTTCVMGTYGYLDPEYFQTSQFTEKSDVYSFGVVLVELITGQKPTYPTESGGWTGLAYEFLFHGETSRLSDILDARVLQEAKEEEVIAVANLARQCLHMSGKMRPSMKEVALVLDGIRSHKLSDLKDKDHEEMKCEITDISDGRYSHFRPNTFCDDNCPDTSRSIDGQPLIHNTF